MHGHGEATGVKEAGKWITPPLLSPPSPPRRRTPANGIGCRDNNDDERGRDDNGPRPVTPSGPSLVLFYISSAPVSVCPVLSRLDVLEPTSLPSIAYLLACLCLHHLAPNYLTYREISIYNRELASSSTTYPSSINSHIQSRLCSQNRDCPPILNSQSHVLGPFTAYTTRYLAQQQTLWHHW